MMLFGGMMLTIPAIGAGMVLGSLAATVYVAVTGAIEGAVTCGLARLGRGALQRRHPLTQRHPIRESTEG
jgi:hypothetical protein